MATEGAEAAADVEVAAVGAEAVASDLPTSIPSSMGSPAGKSLALTGRWWESIRSISTKLRPLESERTESENTSRPESLSTDREESTSGETEGDTMLKRGPGLIRAGMVSRNAVQSFWKAVGPAGYRLAISAQPR